MKRITVLFCLLILSLAVSAAGNIRFWEQYSETEKATFLESGALDTLLSGVYKDSLEITDNEETFQVLDMLSEHKYGSSQNTPISDAFCFHCYTIILNRADGALAEVMGMYCLHIVKTSPDFTILYLKSHEEIRKKFVQYIGYEIYFSQNKERDYRKLRNCLGVDPSFARQFVSDVKYEVRLIEED